MRSQQLRVQVLTHKELHGEKTRAQGRTEIVDAHDVLVDELPGEQDLLLEAGERIVVGGCGKDLERDGRFELKVHGAIHQ